MNLTVSYSEIESFVRNNFHIGVTITYQQNNQISVSLPFTLAGNMITIPFSFSVRDFSNSKLILQLGSTMNGVNDLLKGALTVLHDSVFPFIVPFDDSVFEVNLEQIPQLSSVLNMFSIDSLVLEATEVTVDASLN